MGRTVDVAGGLPSAPRGRPAPVRWTVLWHSKNYLDGVTCRVMWHQTMPLLFPTRRAARSWISEHYGYLKTRPDLRREPHGWRMPEPIRVAVNLVPLCDGALGRQDDAAEDGNGTNKKVSP